jgi:adenylate cyclase, class 2
MVFLFLQMSFLNVEIKARCQHPDFIRKYLQQHAATFIGVDHQTDTYFKINNGRLKLREGNIETNLIFYTRENKAGPKNSHFQLLAVDDNVALKKILTAANGVKIIVNKKREIYFIKNVKFHIDDLPELGSFIEIEAGNKSATKTKEELLQQCKFYLKEFKVQEQDLVANSYSDLLMEKQDIIL